MKLLTIAVIMAFAVLITSVLNYVLITTETIPNNIYYEGLP